uniref:Large ribosomal subunit protein eL20 n=1 Tax=Catagonus wagneri TaxID=51154 RepID=A0A8C3W459_9CETA
MKALDVLQEDKAVGCCLPTPRCHTLPLYHMRIFAPKHVAAKSHFWYFVSQLKKMKESSVETVYWGQAFEKSPLRVKKSGIWLCYNSHSGTHNSYREYRDLTTASAVTQCYRDIGTRPGPRTAPSRIQRWRRSQPASKEKERKKRENKRKEKKKERRRKKVGAELQPRSIRF